jgi:lipopolysaccharide transport system permease protein
VTAYADVFRYRDLFVDLFRREFKVRYRGSVLGVAWTLINPLVLMGVYTLVFSVLLRIQPADVKYFPLFVITGLLTWVFFQSSLQAASATLLGHASLIKQVRFPRQLLPLSVVATNFITFLVMLAVILPVDLWLLPDTRTTFWATFPMIVPLVVLVGSLAVIAACATAIFRDVEHLIAAILLPWFVLSPIIYTFDQLPGLRDHQRLVDVIYYVNFLVPFIEAIRDPLFFGSLPRLTDVVYTVVAALVAFGLATLVFRRVDDRVAEQL